MPIVLLRPVPAPDPADWPGFRAALRESAEWQRIANAANAQHVAELREMMWRVGSEPALFPEIAELWFLIAAAAEPTESEVAALNAALTANAIPMQIDEATLNLEPVLPA